MSLPQVMNYNLSARNQQAESDEQAISLWLHGKASKTSRAYKKQINDFLNYTQKTLRFITLGDIQRYQDYLARSDLNVSSQNTKIMAVKSLCSFCQKIGYLQFNVAAAIQGQNNKDSLAERILTEPEVQAMIHLEPNKRNQVLLKFLYCTGARAVEVSKLRLKDFSESKDGAVVTLFGKGGKTRHVMIPESVWREIQLLHYGNINLDTPAFISRNKKGNLSTSMIWRIVKAAAKRSGIQKKVSPHFLRHSCASHSLDRGCPIHTVQNTLGHSNLSTTGKYTHVRPKDSAGMYLGV